MARAYPENQSYACTTAELNRLREFASQQQLSASWVVRRAVAQYLDRQDNNRPDAITTRA